MIEIIPAIDIIDGKAVRLQKGDYSKKTVYNDNPLEIAKEFEDAGIKRLHLVDLDGAKAKHVINLKVLENISSNTNLVIDFGGGIKSDKDLEKIFNAGASLATVGSIAVTNPYLFEEWIEKFGSAKIILGADVKDEKIAISGWLDITDIHISDFIMDYQKKGIKNILCTDISKDGMLQGTSIDLYRKLRLEFPALNIIASGGITQIEELYRLDNMGIYGAIIGKAYYDGKVKLEDLKGFLKS